MATDFHDKGRHSLKEASFQIIGRCRKEPPVLGKGCKAVVYKDALERELKKAGLVDKGEQSFAIFYEGEQLKHRFEAIFYIDTRISIEEKAATFIQAGSFRQTLHYLKAFADR